MLDKWTPGSMLTHRPGMTAVPDLRKMSSRFAKNIWLRAELETPLLIYAIPHPPRGALRIVRNVGRGMRWPLVVRKTSA
jgi:hypothetical protein